MMPRKKSSSTLNMLTANSPAFKPGMKWDGNNGFLQIISNSTLFRAGKLKKRMLS
jgi:hypothetical protein